MYAGTDLDAAADGFLSAYATRSSDGDVECRTCRKVLKASSLSRHLADVHDIYQQTVIAEDLLEVRPPVLYTVDVRLGIGALAYMFLQYPSRHCEDLYG